jgi:hypothetical protein
VPTHESMAAEVLPEPTCGMTAGVCSGHWIRPGAIGL